MQHPKPSVAQIERQVTLVLEATRWAESRRDCQALGLIGSWARGQAHAASDIDFIALVDQPEIYRGPEWLHQLDWSRVGASVAAWRDETYGAVWSRHMTLDDGTDVEFSFGAPSWAWLEPLDAGTHQALAHGCRVLYDPKSLLRRALDFVTNEAGAA